MSKLKTNAKDAIQSMAVALDKVFKDYSFTSRKSAWENLIKGKGKTEIEKLLANPSKQITGFKGLSFKEWLTANF